MTEDEVNLKVKEWLLSRSFRYKGILKKGLGQVPVPDGIGRSVLIDHQGLKTKPIDLLWIEAKGSGRNFSELLEGFIRAVYAIYYGGGNGYLAVPHKEYTILLGRKDFLKAIAESVNGKGTMGLLDVERGEELLF